MSSPQATEARRAIRERGFRVVTLAFDFRAYQRHQASDGLGVAARDVAWLARTCPKVYGTREQWDVFRRTNAALYAMNDAGPRTGASIVLQLSSV